MTVTVSPELEKLVAYLATCGGQDRYERFMKAKYPELPRRRAFFLAQPRRLGGTKPRWNC